MCRRLCAISSGRKLPNRALKKLVARGDVKKDELVVLFQTGMGLKYDPPLS